MRLRTGFSNIYGENCDELGGYIGELNFITVFSLTVIGWVIFSLTLGRGFVMFVVFNRWVELDF